MKAEFNMSGSALPGWVNTSKEAQIIDRAFNRLESLEKRGIITTSAGPNFVHFMYQGKNGRIKTATYRDVIVEMGDEFIAKISLTFLK